MLGARGDVPCVILLAALLLTPVGNRPTMLTHDAPQECRAASIVARLNSPAVLDPWPGAGKK